MEQHQGAVPSRPVLSCGSPDLDLRTAGRHKAKERKYCYVDVTTTTTTAKIGTSPHSTHNHQRRPPPKPSLLDSSVVVIAVVVGVVLLVVVGSSALAPKAFPAEANDGRGGSVFGPRRPVEAAAGDGSWDGNRLVPSSSRGVGTGEMGPSSVPQRAAMTEAVAEEEDERALASRGGVAKDGARDGVVVASRGRSPPPPTTAAATTTTPTSPADGKRRVTKRLLCVRHGISVANERMALPGNGWGDATFRDDPALVDSPLSPSGWETTAASLRQQAATKSTDATATSGSPAGLREFLRDCRRFPPLVLVSPLTRCLQTYQHGVGPVLAEVLAEALAAADEEEEGATAPPPPVVLAVPLLRERVYTASDTGRPVSVLRREFPSVDFDECLGGGGGGVGEGERQRGGTATTNGDCWWYSPDSAAPPDGVIGASHPDEWRPHGDGQWYAVPGEPEAVFQRRMADLDEFLAGRDETDIVLVTHWGVLRHLSGGEEFANAEARLLEWTYRPVQSPRPGP